MNIFFKTTLLYFCTLTANHVYASASVLDCAPEAGFTPLKLSVSMGDILINGTQKVGDVLSTKVVPFKSNNSYYKCNKPGGPSYRGEMLIAKTASSPGSKVYNTNIQGIGIRIKHDTISFIFDSTGNAIANGRYTLNPGNLTVEIIKTGDVTGSGPLTLGAYAKFHMVGLPDYPWYIVNLEGANNITSSTCNIMDEINRTVTLPRVLTTNFKGYNSSAGGETLFNMYVTCGIGVGGGQNYTQDVQMSFSFETILNPYLLKNTSTDINKASGVGLQLQSTGPGATTVIRDGGTISLGSRQSGNSANIVLPFMVRYYQVENEVKPGKVAAKVILDFVYK